MPNYAYGSMQSLSETTTGCHLLQLHMHVVFDACIDLQLVVETRCQCVAKSSKQDTSKNVAKSSKK